jgi:hypothetical protein
MQTKLRAQEIQGKWERAVERATEAKVKHTELAETDLASAVGLKLQAGVRAGVGWGGGSHQDSCGCATVAAC